jgi:2-oxoisovalerate dehydrogenase E1 component
MSGLSAPDIPETTPGITAQTRLKAASQELLEDVDGFFARAAIAASLTPEERREILRGMVLTRAVDNRLKQLFIGSDVQFEGVPFQGKGFRSLGQEAIYAAAIRLRRGAAWRDRQRGWRGDVVGPIIRDLGVALAMRPDPETIRMVLNAQMAKQGPPMNGKDLHIGDWEWGILPATAPLSVSTMSMAGTALAFWREGSQRVAVSFIGDGGSSLGEWHEAINLCAARRLPAIFCIENNQIALSTPLSSQSATRVFADKARGYGIPGVTLDGTDPDSVAAAFAWAADRARSGLGPALIELVTMRMGGHAHHDDMLYLGKETAPSWNYPSLSPGAYADRDGYAQWTRKDPIASYAARLEAEQVIDQDTLEGFKKDVVELVDTEARAVIDAPWPTGADAARGVFADDVPRVRVEPLDPSTRIEVNLDPGLPELDVGLPFDKKGHTFLEAVALGVSDALRSDPRVFVYGEDVGGRYGNAFLLLRPLLEEFSDRLINSPIAESGVLGVCIGAALAGQRPIGEMQFNDFVASGFNQLVNNAAKIRYRWGRFGADGRAHAVGWPAPCGTVSLAEYRAVVLPHARLEDRHAFDAAGRSRADGRRRCRSGSGPLLRTHRAVSRSAHQATPSAGGARTASARPRRVAPSRRRPRDHFLRRLHPRGDACRRRTRHRRHSRQRARLADVGAARQRRRAAGRASL